MIQTDSDILQILSYLKPFKLRMEMRLNLKKVSNKGYLGVNQIQIKTGRHPDGGFKFFKDPNSTIGQFDTSHTF